MNIRPFINKIDKLNIQKNLFERGLDISDANYLPRFGLIVEERGTFIAAGFLREVEGGYAVMDSLITNKHLDKYIRDITLDRLVSKLIKVAKYNKCKGIIAVTKDKNTIMRSLKHGFIVTDQTHIALNLTSGQGA